MTYRFASIGCTHAGYSTRGMRMHRDTGWNLRVVDGQLAYGQAVTQIIAAGSRGLWHGGDVTHWSRPLPRDVESVQRLDDMLFDAELWNGKNSGNHCAGSGADLSAVAMFDRPTMNAFTVYPDSRRPAEDSVGPHPGLYEIHQPDPDQAVYLHIVSHYGLDPDLRHQGIVIEPQPLDHGINILCSHGIFVGDERLYKAAERHGADRLVPTDWVARGFDLTLLSDFHTPGPVDGFGDSDGRGQVWYTGSTVRRGFSDEESPRGWLQVDLPDGGAPQVTLREIWQRPQRDFDPIDATTMTVAQINDLVRDRLASQHWVDPQSEELTGDGGWILRQRIVGATPQQRQGIYELAGEWANAARDAAYWSTTFENPLSGISLAQPAHEQISITERVVDLQVALDHRVDHGNVGKTLRDAPDTLRDAALARARAALGAPRKTD
ncbi:hypothetical protein O4328_39290 [Rhodococcus opacus]|uniref:Uncharacterized protein n=1 Tax=Rhodococcus opacus TaxID=37919 RepID=A0AAX3YRU6_RHOOP|nr:hypothetical protein [Rhodococcus opacus]MCZ4589616.1 hypothetical protein [Rhodococcus opacus]WLF51225.1 hypothetical protein Q5707_38330 [Rhodococcus opacus]